MKRVLTVLLLLMCAVTMSAAAQPQMDVYVAADTLDQEVAERLMELTRSEFPQAEWSCEMQTNTGRSLREVMLADDVPEIVICAPRDACVWAKEGLFEGLDACAGDMEAVNSQVISACTEDGRLYMAPLTATQRQIAVNRRLLERQHFDYLTSATEHPVWYPMEFDQLLEDLALAKIPAVQILAPRP